MPEKTSLGQKVSANIRNYIVTYVFLLISVVFVVFSGQTMNYVFSSLVARLTRNLFIVMALIIPIVAGMGINFAITIGAMAAQIALLLVIDWGVTGVGGIALAALITVPLAVVFGIGIGALMNKMKGQETIGSMILGYFATGLYQLLFLYIFGNVIPMSNKVTIVGSTGIKNTLNLMGDVDLYKVVDKIWQVPFTTAVLMGTGLVVALAVLLLALKKVTPRKALTILIPSVALCACYFIPVINACFAGITVPVVTFLIVGLLCLFNVAIMKTRLGQKFRAVGQSMTVANAAGINVNRTRIIAIVISTVLAGWGQILFLQNLGTLQTYAAHEMVGLYAGAAILVGGASIDRATNSQALIGCLIFHTLFIVAQDAGKNIFGDPNVGEYFRVFMSYGVIALALVMYAWRSAKEAKDKLKTR
ncbi:MAG: ABC transporter permease [Eubacteriales bacterium]|nr:ABC transporter permease [Eubacteriales bacterium]